MKAIVAALSLTLAAPCGAVAQTVPVDDPEANLLAELIVIAPTEGPAWWRVSKGDSVVWIMAMPASATPRDMTWDSKALDRRLKGARALLVWPRIQVRIGGPAKDDPPVAVPPALGARFARVRTRIAGPRGVTRHAFRRGRSSNSRKTTIGGRSSIMGPAFRPWSRRGPGGRGCP